MALDLASLPLSFGLVPAWLSPPVEMKRGNAVDLLWTAYRWATPARPQDQGYEPGSKPASGGQSPSNLNDTFTLAL